MATTNRSAIRKKLAELLEADLTTVEALYSYQKTQFSEGMPVVRVMSAGSLRPPSIAAGNATRFYFVVQVWVLFSEIDGNWTEENADDTLDAIETEIADWVDQNQQVVGYWKTVQYAQRSTTRIIEEDGEAWLVEDIPLEIRVHDP